MKPKRTIHINEVLTLFELDKSDLPVLGTPLPYEVVKQRIDEFKQTLKKRFRRLAMKHHPDHGGDEEYFKKLSDVYTFLMKELKPTKAPEPEPRPRPQGGIVVRVYRSASDYYYSDASTTSTSWY
jgi:hypothetical protein